MSFALTEQCKLSGNIELDEYYLAINLKGTKKKNMPRAVSYTHLDVYKRQGEDLSLILLFYLRLDKCEDNVL